MNPVTATTTVCSIWPSRQFPTVRRNMHGRLSTLLAWPFFSNVHPRHTAGLGVFAGTFFGKDELIGRVGDPAFPTVDQDWHNSPETGLMSKTEGDYHWPLANYDWNAPDIGCEYEAEDISVTVTGFGGEDFAHIKLRFSVFDSSSQFFCDFSIPFSCHVSKAAPNCHFRLINVHEHKVNIFISTRKSPMSVLKK